jgi:hypothetical protein
VKPHPLCLDIISILQITNRLLPNPFPPRCELLDKGVKVFEPYDWNT